jgi:hypothetical protein
VLFWLGQVGKVGLGGGGDSNHIMQFSITFTGAHSLNILVYVENTFESLLRGAGIWISCNGLNSIVKFESPHHVMFHGTIPQIPPLRYTLENLRFVISMKLDAPVLILYTTCNYTCTAFLNAELNQ